MHPRYPSIERDLLVVEAFEKVAAQVGPEFHVEAQEQLASACDELFSQFMHSARPPPDADPMDKCAAVVEFVLDLRAANTEAGKKTAASSEVLLENSVKLATAVYVDEVLTAQLASLSGPAKEAALRTRSLGREYAVSLLSALLT